MWHWIFSPSSLLSQTGLPRSHQNVSPILRRHLKLQPELPLRYLGNWDLLFPPDLTSLSSLVTVHHSSPSSHLSDLFFLSLIVTSPRPVLPLLSSPSYGPSGTPDNQARQHPESFHQTLPSPPGLTWGLDDRRAQLLLHTLEGKLDTNFISKQGQQQVCPPSPFQLPLSTNSFTSIQNFYSFY